MSYKKQTLQMEEVEISLNGVWGVCVKGFFPGEVKLSLQKDR